MDVKTALVKILRDNMVECKDCSLWKECEDKDNLCMKLADKIDAGGLGYQGTVEVDEL